MQRSPFAFLCGSAAIMAEDLAATPTSGIWLQSAGDCHLANFGIYAASDGTPVFDLADFDETLPAPFEWDLKRLAASVVVFAGERMTAERVCRDLARTVATAYRRHMIRLMRLDPQRAWRSRVDVSHVFEGIDDAKLRQRELKRVRLACEAHRKGYRRLLEHTKRGWRIRRQPPLIPPASASLDDTLHLVARTAFEAYKHNQSEERGILLDRYRLADVTFRLGGIGRIGIFSALGLFTDRDGATLLLQLTEAHPSLLAPYTAPSAYRNQGERVVIGQRILQAERDIFLGWTHEPGTDQHCYVRELRDSRLISDDDITDAVLPYCATLCGMALARAHARSGDAARIAGYMGSSSSFDAAIAEFAMKYAAQVQSDWRLFVEAIKARAVEARNE
jgi:uncharacterized protein (DUF2252 family)